MALSGVLRQIQTTFLTSNSTGNYTAPATNILSLPGEVKAMDGSGTLYSDTKLGYDEQGLTGYSTIVGHDVNYSGGGVRGNLTSVMQYLTQATAGSPHSIYSTHDEVN